MSEEHRVLSSAHCHLRVPSSLALLCDLDVPSKTTQQGILRCTLQDNSFLLHFSSISGALLKNLDPNERKLLILPEWIRAKYSIEDNDRVVIEKIDATVIAAKKVIIKALTRTPALSCISGIFKGTLLTDSMIFSLKLSGVLMPCLVISIEGTEDEKESLETKVYQVTGESEVLLEQEPITESVSVIFDTIYADDVKRMMMYASATRLHISGEYKETSIHALIHKDHRVLNAFIRALKAKLPSEAWIELDLYGLAEDDEIDISPEAYDRTIASMCDRIIRSGAKTIHVPRSSRLSASGSIQRLQTLLLQVRKDIPELEVILTDTERSAKLLKLLGRTDGFRLNEFEPSPLKHEQRKAYILDRLGKGGKLEEAIDLSKWRLGGLDIETLDRIVESVRESRPKENNLAVALRTAIDRLGSEGRPAHLRMLGRGLGSWDRIQGYEQELLRLKSLLYGPWLERERYARFGITSSPGILLHGPSGCGKTSIVRAIANDSIFNVIELDMAAVKSKYLGETEERLRAAFKMARQEAPCILFIDGVDALGKRRALGANSSESGGSEERLLSTLLNEMDGIESLGDVIVIGCTSRPEMIDSALKRPGRLELHIEMCLPRQEDRRAIVRYRLALMNISEDHLDRLVEESDGLSSAQIVQAFQAAGHRALMRSPDNPQISADDINFV